MTTVHPRHSSSGPRASMAAISFVGALLGAALLAGPAFALTEAEIANYKGADRQQILEAGAKKEGKVVFYSSMIVQQAIRPILDAFKKKYPYLQTEYWRADSRQIIAKLGAERRAKAVNSDVLEMGGGGDAAMKMGAVQPFTSPMQAAYPAEFKAPMWNAVRMTTYGTVYNTKQVPEADVPNTYEKLLDPKWKNKMAWRANSETGDTLVVANILNAMGKEKGQDYLMKLSAQKIVNYTASARSLVDRVLQGEYAICLGCAAHHAMISKSKGAPVDVAMVAPVPVNIATVMLSKDIKHPHAAMLLLDFILSPDGGQKVLREGHYLPAHPKTPPLEYMTKISPMLTNTKMFVYDPDGGSGDRDLIMGLLKKNFK